MIPMMPGDPFDPNFDPFANYDPTSFAGTLLSMIAKQMLVIRFNVQCQFSIFVNYFLEGVNAHWHPGPNHKAVRKAQGFVSNNVYDHNQNTTYILQFNLLFFQIC